MGRASRKRKQGDSGKTREPRPPLGSRADLPPSVAEFMAIFDDMDEGFTVGPSEGGTVWTIRDRDGAVAMEFGSGPTARDRPLPPGTCGPYMDVGKLWADPEFQRQRDAGLVDTYGRPLHPEGRDFFSQYHNHVHGHDH